MAARVREETGVGDTDAWICKAGFGDEISGHAEQVVDDAKRGAGC